MKKYSYNGPVMYFEDCIVEHYKAETLAVSEKKARSNLEYQWKIKNGYAPNANIHLPGKIKIVDSFDSGDQIKLKI